MTIPTQASTETLIEFVGGRARLWHYTASHDRLGVELTSPQGVRRYLVLVFCDELSLPVMWSIVRPTLTRLTDELIEFRDTGVRITCLEAQLRDRYE